MTKKNTIILSIVFLLLVWIGIPTVLKWRADKKVDRLCSTQAHVNVHETIIMPPEEYKKFHLKYFSGAVYEPDVSYYGWTSTNVIEGDINSLSATTMVIYKSTLQIYSTTPRRLLGETVTFTRRGGDPFGAFMPSSHSCHFEEKDDLLRKVFVKYQ